MILRMFIVHHAPCPGEAWFFLPACQTCPGCSFLYFFFPWLLVVLWRPSTSRGQIFSPWMGEYSRLGRHRVVLVACKHTVCSLAGRYDNPMPESTISPPSGTKNLATVKNQLGPKHYVKTLHIATYFSCIRLAVLLCCNVSATRSSISGLL